MPVILENESLRAVLDTGTCAPGPGRWSSPACTHLVLYNPAGKPYFAAEPVTNANDGVNLLARGDAGCGTVVLEPGESLEARFSLHLEWL